MRHVFLVCVSLLICSASHAGGRVFTVKNVEGQVLSWRPWGSRWEPVLTGEELPEATLVEVPPGALLTFEMDSRRGFSGIHGETLEVTLNKPIVVRLDSQVVRQVKLDTYFVPTLPKNAASPSALLSVKQAFHEAWERFATIVVKEGFQADWIAGMREPAQETSLALRSRPIEILVPIDNLTAMTMSLPYDFRISWKAVADPDATYELRVWPFNAVRPAPVAITKLTYHHVDLPKEGGYFIQVSTPDGRWQSPVVRLFAALPLAGRMQDVALKPAPRKRPLPLLNPPAGFTYFTKALPTTLEFQWRMPWEVAVDHPFTVVLADQTGKEIVTQQVRGQKLSLQFAAPGQYHWRVQTQLVQEGQPQNMQSETREVRIAAPGTFGRDIGGDASLGPLLSGAQGVWYMEEGL